MKINTLEDIYDNMKTIEKAKEFLKYIKDLENENSKLKDKDNIDEDYYKIQQLDEYLHKEINIVFKQRLIDKLIEQRDKSKEFLKDSMWLNKYYDEFDYPIIYYQHKVLVDFIDKLESDGYLL